MDAGVYGIIFSTVENIDYVRNIHFCCSYPPNGSRGQGLCAENGWGEFPNLLQNRKPEIIAQIETKEGMDVLPIFMRLEEDGVHRIDRFLIGPYDLSASLGHVGDWDHPDFIDQMDKFNAIVPDEKKAIHLVSDIDRQRSKYKNYGLLAMGMDTLAVTRDVRRLNSFS
jgi:2-dehydro-3-deoxyglucarate aldolase